MNVLHIIPAFKKKKNNKTNSDHLLPCWYTVLHHKSAHYDKTAEFQVHLILRCRSYSCKFAYFLQCIFGPKSTLMALLQSFADMSTVTKKSEPPNHSQLSLSKVTLCCRVPAHTWEIYLVPLFLYLGACYHFSLKMSPKCRAEALPNVPRFKKVVMCLTEKNTRVRHSSCGQELQPCRSWVHHPKWMNTIY